MTRAAAAAAVFLTVAETKAAAADGERPGPGPARWLCRAAVGAGPAPAPRGSPPAPPRGRRGTWPGPVLRALLQPPPGESEAVAAPWAAWLRGDVEPGLPVEVRGSNGAFYKVRRRASQDAVVAPSSSQNGEEWGGIEVLG